MERTLIITGKGKLSVNPDLVIINFPIEIQNLNYGTAVDELNKLVNRVKDTIASLGVDKKEIKTQNFRINTLTRWKKRTERNELLGFSAQHDLILEIPFDNILVNKIITNIIKLDNGIEIKISFSVKDKEGCIQTLIENAIKNAKEKARIMANASDVQLKEILNINYSFSDVYIHSNTDWFYNKSVPMVSEDSMPEITPAEIELSENVTITWRIE